MHLRLASLLLAASVVMMPTICHGGTNKNGKATISFHLQGNRGDNPKMIFTHEIHGQKLVFSRMPEITTKDIASFRSFPTENEADGLGVLVYLKPHAAQRLSLFTNANRGKWLAVGVNGRIVDAVIINDQVNDGILVIWKNLSPADIATIEKAVPHQNQKTED